MSSEESDRAALRELKRVLRVFRVGRSYVAQIGVPSYDPDKAASIANAIARTYVDYQANYRVLFTERESAPALARLIAPAPSPASRAGLKLPVLLLLGASAGVCAGICFAGLRAAADEAIRSADDLEFATGLDCLGVLPFVGGIRKQSFATGDVISEPSCLYFAEVLLLARSILQDRRQVAGCTCVGFAAPHLGAGNTTVAVRFAQLLAAGGEKVLVVGHAEETTRDEGKVTKSEPEIIEMPRGALFRRSDWLRNALGGFRHNHDWIIVDLPALAAPGTARTMTQALDQIVVVLEWGQTTPEELQTSLRSIRPFEGKLAGVLINKSKRLDHGNGR